MLKINVRGENIEVTGSIREYVEKKLAKLREVFRRYVQFNGSRKFKSLFG